VERKAATTSGRAANLPGVDPVLKVSIIPRGVGARGYTIQRPREDRFLLGQTDLENRISRGDDAAGCKARQHDANPNGAARDLAASRKLRRAIIAFLRSLLGSSGPMRAEHAHCI
jgi:cell division protease FtsH